MMGQFLISCPKFSTFQIAQFIISIGQTKNNVLPPSELSVELSDAGFERQITVCCAILSSA